MKREKVMKTLTEVDIAQATVAFSTKYQKFTDVLTQQEISLIMQQAVNELKGSPEENQIFSLIYVAEKIFLIKARDEILNGNIDLEIRFIERYRQAALFLLRQIKYTGDDIEKLAEDAIIKTIENYQGPNSFKRTLLVTLRELISTAEEKRLDISAEINEGANNNELMIPEDGLVRLPNQLELLIHEADILNKVPLEDPLYIKFLTLKYGYHNNQYFNLEEISRILSISIDEAIRYYQQSLQYLKDWFGMQLDKVYTYCTQKSE